MPAIPSTARGAKTDAPRRRQLPGKKRSSKKAQPKAAPKQGDKPKGSSPKRAHGSLLTGTMAAPVSTNILPSGGMAPAASQWIHHAVEWTHDKADRALGNIMGALSNGHEDKDLNNEVMEKGGQPEAGAGPVDTGALLEPNKYHKQYQMIERDIGKYSEIYGDRGASLSYLQLDPSHSTDLSMDGSKRAYSKEIRAAAGQLMEMRRKSRSHGVSVPQGNYDWYLKYHVDIDPDWLKYSGKYWFIKPEFITSKKQIVGLENIRHELMASFQGPKSMISSWNRLKKSIAFMPDVHSYVFGVLPGLSHLASIHVISRNAKNEVAQLLLEDQSSHPKDYANVPKLVEELGPGVGYVETPRRWVLQQIPNPAALGIRALDLRAIALTAAARVSTKPGVSFPKMLEKTFSNLLIDIQRPAYNRKVHSSERIVPQTPRSARLFAHDSEMPLENRQAVSELLKEFQKLEEASGGKPSEMEDEEVQVLRWRMFLKSLNIKWHTVDPRS